MTSFKFLIIIITLVFGLLSYKNNSGGTLSRNGSITTTNILHNVAFFNLDSKFLSAAWLLVNLRYREPASLIYIFNLYTEQEPASKF